MSKEEQKKIELEQAKAQANALQVAIQKTDLNRFNELLNKNARWDIKIAEQTAVDILIAKTDSKYLPFKAALEAKILEKCANATSKNQALRRAANAGWLASAKFLIHAGADIHAAALTNNKAALDYAIEQKHTEMIVYLEKIGAKQNEFVTYDNKPSGSDDFNDVIQRLAVNKLFWPKSTQIAQQIYAIVNNKTVGSAQEVYDQIQSLETKDLRPHLLLLLKGFDENNQHYSITRSLFQTLHVFAEFSLSKMHKTQPVKVLTLQEGMPYLGLDQSTASTLQTTVNNSNMPPAENNIFYIPIDKSHLEQRVVDIITKIYDDNVKATDDNRTPEEKKHYYLTINNILLGNINFLEKFAVLYDFEHIKKFVKVMKKWQDDISDYLNKNENNQIVKFPYSATDLYLLAVKANINIKMQVDLTTAVMDYEYNPLMDYRYDDSKKNWYFIFLNVTIYDLYCKATQQKSNTVFCYGLITAEEMILQFLQEKPRLGAITHYEHDENHYKQYIYHKDPQPFLAAAIIHDSAHQHILAKLSASKVSSIMRRWISLIGEKTNLYKTYGPNKIKVPFTHETWVITDCPFASIFLAKNDLEMLAIIYERIFNHLHTASIVRCMLVLDMLLSDKFYYGLAENTEKLPRALEQVEKHRSQIIQIYNKLLGQYPNNDNTNDPFVIASICIYALDNQACAKNFTPQDIVTAESKIDLLWKKNRKNNMVALHAGLPDNALKESKDDKNIYLNDFVL
ncbi:MAG: hypothetical protein WC748_07345 [Legionellales bacterium]|jgi:hypothetical protein